MIYSGNVARLPGADTVDYSSGTAELLDDGFMDQFNTVNPQDLHYQTDIDNWDFGDYAPDTFSLPYEAFHQGDSSLYPQDPDNGVSLNIDAQHNTNLKQAPDVQSQLRAAQDPIYSRGISADNQHTPSLQQAPYVLGQFQGPRDPNNGACNGTGLNESPRSPDLDQLYQNMEKSIEICQGPIYGLEFDPDSQHIDFGQPLDTVNQSQDPLYQITTGGSATLDPIDELTTFGSTDNGPVHQSGEAPGDFVNPASSWIGLTPGIEQPPFVQENFPQAPCPPIYTPPDNQYLIADNKLPPPPRREKKQPKVPLNKRQANIESIDPSKYYQRLSEAPHSWKPRSGNGMSTFQYNEYGELSTNDKFSPDQILQYLYDNPFNYDRNNLYDNKNSRLTLWIQVTPADSGRRYPSANSSKCRFADCPISRNSIRKGFFRVAFDEHTASGRQIDPYHCAGFVHLFCLEKFCNFPNICQNLIVLPDQRILPEGRNKMALTRDHEEMVEVVRTFIQSSQKPMPWDYEQTLCFRLTSKHLELEPTVRKATRERRGGNHIALHKGDLDKFAAGEILKVEQRRAAPPAQKPPKRKRDIAEEEEDMANLEDEVKRQQRSMKRRWRFR